MVVILLRYCSVSVSVVFSIHMLNHPKNTSDWCQDLVLLNEGYFSSGSVETVLLLSLLSSFLSTGLFYSFLSACSINIPLVFQALFWSRTGCSSCFPSELWFILFLFFNDLFSLYRGTWNLCLWFYLFVVCDVSLIFCVVVVVVDDVFPPVCFCPWFLVPSFCTLPLTPLSSVCLSVFVMWPPHPPPRRHGLSQSDKLRSVLSSALLFSSSSTLCPSSSLFVTLSFRNNSPKTEIWFII